MCHCVLSLYAFHVFCVHQKLHLSLCDNSPADLSALAFFVGLASSSSFAAARLVPLPALVVRPLLVVAVGVDGFLAEALVFAGDFEVC